MPVPAAGAPLVNSGGQLAAQVPEQLLVFIVSLEKIYRVMPFESTRIWPKEALWPTLTVAAVPACPVVGVGPVTGTTAVGAVVGALVAGGILVAGGMLVTVGGIGVAGAQAERISASRATPKNSILVFIRFSDLVLSRNVLI